MHRCRPASCNLRWHSWRRSSNRQMPRQRTSASDLFFRSGTGFFALVLVLIVAGIATVLWQGSTASILKFGLQFWVTGTWDPVLGEFGARPFIWGTLYSS